VFGWFRQCNVNQWRLQDVKAAIFRSLRSRAQHLSVRTAGGASDRHRLKARLPDGLTYLLTYFWKLTELSDDHCSWSFDFVAFHTVLCIVLWKPLLFWFLYNKALILTGVN